LTIGPIELQHQPGEGDCTLQQSCRDPRCAPAPWRILVVEDEVLIRLLIVDILIEAGFQVIQAASADEALKVLQSSVEVDLVMTDIRMPGSLDGLELASRVRANWPTLRIVIVSSDASSLRPDLPADAVIAKPFSPIEFVDRVKQLLGFQNDQP
jgi:CheY-like chemotaxis protein